MTSDDFDDFLPNAQTMALVLDQEAADQRINEIRSDEVLADMVATLKRPDAPRDAEPSERIETVDPKTVPPNNAGPRITLSTVKVAPELAEQPGAVLPPKVDAPMAPALPGESDAPPPVLDVPIAPAPMASREAHEPAAPIPPREAHEPAAPIPSREAHEPSARRSRADGITVETRSEKPSPEARWRLPWWTSLAVAASVIAPILTLLGMRRIRLPAKPEPADSSAMESHAQAASSRSAVPAPIAPAASQTAESLELGSPAEPPPPASVTPPKRALPGLVKSRAPAPAPTIKDIF